MTSQVRFRGFSSGWAQDRDSDARHVCYVLERASYRISSGTTLSTKDYEILLRMVSARMDAKKDTAEGDELELLSRLVHAHEDNWLKGS